MQTAEGKREKVGWLDLVDSSPRGSLVDVMKLLRVLITIITIITIITVFALSAARADTASNYVGEITGLVCASCKEEVVAALSKLEGVKNVEIVPSNHPEIRKITIATTRATLTSADVNLALDKVSKEFKVTKLAKAEPLISK